MLIETQKPLVRLLKWIPAKIGLAYVFSKSWENPKIWFSLKKELLIFNALMPNYWEVICKRFVVSTNDWRIVIKNLEEYKSRKILKETKEDRISILFTCYT